MVNEAGLVEVVLLAGGSGSSVAVVVLVDVMVVVVLLVLFVAIEPSLPISTTIKNTTPATTATFPAFGSRPSPSSSSFSHSYPCVPGM